MRCKATVLFRLLDVKLGGKNYMRLLLKYLVKSPELYGHRAMTADVMARIAAVTGGPPSTRPHRAGTGVAASTSAGGYYVTGSDRTGLESQSPYHYSGQPSPHADHYSVGSGGESPRSGRDEMGSMSPSGSMSTSSAGQYLAPIIIPSMYGIPTTPGSISEPPTPAQHDQYSDYVYSPRAALDSVNSVPQSPFNFYNSPHSPQYTYDPLDVTGMNTARNSLLTASALSQRNLVTDDRHSELVALKNHDNSGLGGSCVLGGAGPVGASATGELAVVQVPHADDSFPVPGLPMRLQRQNSITSQPNWEANLSLLYCDCIR